jgi:hypothetical protein
MKFTEADLKQIEERGSQLKTVQAQIEDFRKGFQFLQLQAPATPGDGIIVLGQQEIDLLTGAYDKAATQKQIVKFVPASGAASRMFKMLYGFLEISNDQRKVGEAFNESGDLQSISTFFDTIEDFAFASDLDLELKKQDLSLKSCLEDKDYQSILNALLQRDGLGYGSSPKGLLMFHKYANSAATPAMEHLSEGALYAASSNKQVNIHFTVSPEHRQKFEEHIQSMSPIFEEKYSVTYHISFSEQKAFTDTIAVDLSNEPFRNPDNSLLFRPAGHGALIANLNDIDADIIFIKNIDNVVPDKLKADTVLYKKALAGTLLKMQEKIFTYLKQLDTGADDSELDKMLVFLQEELQLKNLPVLNNEKEKSNFIRMKLDRPIRVCGMVKNEGEPGGGPFFAHNNDGTQSLQIVESSQIDFNDDGQKVIADSATHFNPVDLVCGVRNYRGEKFDLSKYVDPKTGFISKKSKDGKELKAQELPGLWNGAMSDWNTLFMEVPISTFNPVKTVNDLLRPQHQ